VSNKETAPHENVYRIAIVHRYSGADLRQGEWLVVYLSRFGQMDPLKQKLEV
jgi:hypothetical protein